MKRRELLKHLRAHGCRFLREGGEHSVWENPATGKSTTVPRHLQIVEYTAMRICQQLGVPPP